MNKELMDSTKISSNIINKIVSNNNWCDLPNDIANSVTCKKIMGDYNSLGVLFHFRKGSIIFKNYNEFENETLDIRSGSIKNTITGVTYEEGDIIPIECGKLKGLEALEDAYVYCVMATK
jgi:hypothetical protein